MEGHHECQRLPITFRGWSCHVARDEALPHAGGDCLDLQQAVGRLRRRERSVLAELVRRRAAAAQLEVAARCPAAGYPFVDVLAYLAKTGIAGDRAQILSGLAEHEVAGVATGHELRGK